MPQNRDMRITPEGLQLIRDFEGCSLAAYWDGGVDENRVGHGKLTIGYGSTHNVTVGMVISKEEAEDRLFKEAAEIEQIVQFLVHAPLTDNQISALTSFVFNVGLGRPGDKDGFRYLKNGEPSTLLKCLNSMRFMEAADEFEKWCHRDGTVSEGLLRRRKAERALFSKPDGMIDPPFYP